MSGIMRIIMIACCTLYFGILAVTPMLAKKVPMNLDLQGRALQGYDPVAYFVQGKAVPGSPEFEYRWNGATWEFSSDENRSLFRSDTRSGADKYIPAYGGYCAFGMAEGYVSDIDPKVWTVFGGKLYLAHDPQVKQKWEKDIPGNVERANINWPAALDKSR
jgi:hypothetical protein